MCLSQRDVLYILYSVVICTYSDNTPTMSTWYLIVHLLVTIEWGSSFWQEYLMFLHLQNAIHDVTQEETLFLSRWKKNVHTKMSSVHSLSLLTVALNRYCQIILNCLNRFLIPFCLSFAGYHIIYIYRATKGQRGYNFESIPSFQWQNNKYLLMVSFIWSCQWQCSLKNVLR